MHRLSSLVLVMILISAAPWPNTVRADAGEAAKADLDSGARAAHEAGAQAYDAGRFDEALRQFELAYSLSARPKLLFNIGRAADGDAQYERAKTAYEAYLQAMPAADNRVFVESRIAKMRELISRGGAIPPAAAASHPESPASIPGAGVVPAAPSSSTAGPLLSPTPPTAAARPDIALGPAAVGRPGEAKPYWKRGWFWGVAGAVVAGAITAAILGTRDHAPHRAGADEYFVTGGR